MNFQLGQQDTLKAALLGGLTPFPHFFLDDSPAQEGVRNDAASHQFDKIC